MNEGNERIERNNVFTELIFTKTTSKSEAKKINEFWKFIESQNDIKPYVVEKKVMNPTSSEIKDETLACQKERCEENFRKEQLFKILGLDKVPPIKSKYKKAIKKKNDNLILSDMVEQTYEEINDELKKFETRLEK